MTQVDFYMTAGENERARLGFACRLVEKALSSGKRIYLLTQDQQQSSVLDKLLWTFKPGSFIPHELQSDSTDPDCPVLISHNQPPEQERQVLLNLSDTVPEFFSRFERVLEILNQQPETRDLGRSRYSFYRDRGYPLKYHEIKRA